jgi:hypothetical protein
MRAARFADKRNTIASRHSGARPQSIRSTDLAQGRSPHVDGGQGEILREGLRRSGLDAREDRSGEFLRLGARTRNGNSSVTSTRTKYFSVKSVLRLVWEKMTSTTFRVPLSGDGLTSTALRKAF